MSLIRPQGNNRVRKEARELSMRKRGAEKDSGPFPVLLDEKENIWDLAKFLNLDGQTPLFILHNPDQYDFAVVSREPITEEGIDKALAEEREEEE